MKKLLVLFSALFLLASGGQALAQELKVGIIDMNQILQKSPLMISLNNELTKKFQSRQDELIKAQKQLQDDNNKLMVDTSLTPEARTQLQNKIITEQANVQILTASLQRDLAIAKDEALQKFMRKFNEVIARVAKDQQYDLIQQNTGVAFVNSRLDITQSVVDQIK